MILRGVLRNFGGMPKADAEKFLLPIVESEFGWFTLTPADKSTILTMMNPLELCRDNLNTPWTPDESLWVESTAPAPESKDKLSVANVQSRLNEFLRGKKQPEPASVDEAVNKPSPTPTRHLLLLSTANSSWQMLFEEENLLSRDRCVVIFNSEFSGDQNALQHHSSIAQIRGAAERGDTLLLLWPGSIAESLYHLLNLCYSRYANRFFCRLSVGASSLRTAVHQTFKCIVVVNDRDAYEQRVPIPFVNRFEKQRLDRDEILSPPEQKLVASAHQRLAAFALSQSLSTVVPGFNDQSLASLVAVVKRQLPRANDRELLHEMIGRLMATVTPESVLRAKNSAEDRKSTRLNSSHT